MSKIIKRRSLLAAGATAIALPAQAAIVNGCGAPINASGPLTNFPGLIINGTPPATITLTSVPSSGSVGVGVSIAFSYTSAAPTGLTAVWNPGAISGAVTGFSASGGTGSATVSPPSTTGTYTLTVTGTGPNSGTSTASNPTVIGAAESVAGTVVNTLGSSTTTIGGAIYASQTPGIAGGPLNIIGINSAGQILVNSGSGFVEAPGSANVIELYYASNHTCYQENSSLNWYGPTTASSLGAQVPNPIPLINSITATPVSNSPAGYPSTGVEVATLSAAVSGINGSGNYATFTGTFSIAAGSAAGFSINNSASPPQILTNAVPAAGSYNLNITATQTGTIGGVTVPPYTTPTPLTVNVGIGITTPPALAAHGLNWKVAFFDDFTSNTIYPGLGTTPVAGYNWYWDQCVNSTSDYEVSPGLTAATIPSTITINGVVIPQGNSGGGSNASPAGGVLTLLLQPLFGFSGNIATVPYNNNDETAVIKGRFKHAYFECYMQFNPDIQSVVPPGQTSPEGNGTFGWPGFWSTGLFNANTGTPSYTEVDFFEFYGTAFQNPRPTNIQTSAIDWPSPGITGSNGKASHSPIDANWHTYGCLWESTGTGTGMLTFYFDNVEYGSCVTGTGVNPNNGGSFLESNGYLCLRFGAGNQWPANVDWVRVWNPNGDNPGT